MSFKFKSAMGLIKLRMVRRKSTVSPSGENAFPLILGGRPIQQLPLPRQMIGTNESRVAGNVKAIKPSDLEEVRAKLAARKRELG